ncbi:2-polyprenyl-3-methyl-5-hydroxy-6-metoxy-1,4-benzoquinol methylase [Paenibacillus shirakamiensis]|uniref:2-polyprenyl-3-methyl-5-hydroxy-6-metoxy-1, 4-benzoquinol methylase n=1 Tax=Paenibacillus shirakamiensis TaxID=1265935 RepID=A0ABS4JF31_9BACL|nr:class I SAM-dependent methyltransferase [Paenibacillus shirakamiensis]MBP2000314.1 2-polyprenyl-3-methyl-5-hydroxy-6-metoxy-1,4-benzoquinol methylase [Paenibacillus shirakamiensis]
MSQANFEEARQAEEAYHSKLYQENDILEPGTWMSRPIPLVMELLDRILLHRSDVRIMDLGSGAGRNTIPLAQKLQGNESRIIGVDLLEEAVQKLQENAEKYGVQRFVESRQGDAEHTDFQENHYDYIVACGCLEHVSSEKALREVIQRMQKGTRLGGIHCIAMNTNIEEVEQETGKAVEPLIELNLQSQQAFDVLNQAYEGWNVLKEHSVLQSIEEEKYDTPTEFRSQSITFVAQRLK